MGTHAEAETQVHDGGASFNSRKPDPIDPIHFAYIDAVRGFAFLAVLTVHAALSVGHFSGRNLLCQGGYGVQLFFIASAITLCNSMSSRQQRDRYPVAYFVLN